MEQYLMVLLVEDDENACEELRRYIDQTPDIRLQNVTNNSKEALTMVRAGLPDAIILDLELHYGGGNGLLFLDGLKKLHLSHNPYILVTTNNSSVITLEQARAMGADFIMAKYETQYSAQYVVEFLRMMSKAILAESASAATGSDTPSEEEQMRILTQRVHRELDYVGISPKAIGYQYLTDAIILSIDKSQPNLCKKLSLKYRKTDVSIERAMQNAINRAWRTTDPDDLLEHYTARVRSDKGVPTLMEFISHYAHKYKDED